MAHYVGLLDDTADTCTDSHVEGTSSSSDAVIAAAAADAAKQCGVDNMNGPLPLAVDANTLLACHQSDTFKYSIGRSVLLLGEDHVGKHTLLATLHALQEQCHMLQPESDLLSSDQLLHQNERRLQALCDQNRGQKDHVERNANNDDNDDDNDGRRHRHRYGPDTAQRSHSVKGVDIAFRRNGADHISANGDSGSVRPRVCSLELTFCAQDTRRFSVATLLRTHDYSILSAEYRRWSGVTFFVIMFNLYDASSFLAAIKWVDIVTALLNAKQTSAQRLSQTDGACRAWLIGTYRSTEVPSSNGKPPPLTDRHVHRTVASELAQRRNMRYSEVNVYSFVDAERLCVEMFRHTSELAIRRHDQQRMAKAQKRQQQKTLSTSSSSSPSSSPSPSPSGSLSWLGSWMPEWLCNGGGGAEATSSTTTTNNNIETLSFSAADFAAVPHSSTTRTLSQ